MKKLIALLLALLALAPFANADRILIYQGVQSDTTNAKITDTKRYFWLFDIDSLVALPVSYQISGTSKTFTTGNTTSIVYSPILTTNSNTTQTCFQFGGSNMSESFNLQFGLFQGNNTRYNLGGNFIGNFPPVLTFTTYAISGNGEIGSDTVSRAVSSYHLNLTLTQQSNKANDNLSAALAIVAAYLNSNGYVSTQ